MQANNRDAASLWDMVQAIHRIQEFTANLSREAYLESTLIQSAVERQLEVLGEAARRLSVDIRQANPDIDWLNIIGLRNVIAHRYEQVRQDLLWNIVTTVMPPLLEQLEALIPPLLPEQEN
jgi:uncharacterized protein with HEPN domain